MENEKLTQATVYGQKVYINQNVPIAAKLVFAVITLFLLTLPLVNMFKTLDIWNSYTKTRADILHIDRRYIPTEAQTGIYRERERDIKYFVRVAYTLDNRLYEGIITNDKGYLRSVEQQALATTHTPRHNARFRRMKVGSEVVVYVNPDNPHDVAYEPTLLARSDTLLLLIGIPCVFLLIGMFKTSQKNKYESWQIHGKPTKGI
jgi:hypothetical protein